jgi:transcriptional regulator GlxA family with amidase domain
MAGTNGRTIVEFAEVFSQPPVLPTLPVEPELKVGFILSPNFTLLPFAGFIDALRHAADVSDYSRQVYCRWTFLAPEIAPVRASCGLETTPWELFGDPRDFDYIVVTGGLLPSCLDLPPATYDFLREATRQNVPLVGLCTGSFVLANAGLLEGRRCSVHLRHAREFAALFPDVIPATDETYVLDGNIYSCPGGMAAIDLAADLIAKHCGKARAAKSLRAMVVEQHRAAHYIPRRRYEHMMSCGDPQVERAVSLMEENIETPYPIKTLAQQVGVSVSCLDRAFAKAVGMAPSVFWRTIRLDHVHWLLCNSSRNITEIALECGFYDSTHLCKSYRDVYGETPRKTRQRARAMLALSG